METKRPWTLYLSPGGGSGGGLSMQNSIASKDTFNKDGKLSKLRD